MTDEAGAVQEQYLYDPFGHPFIFAPDGVTQRSVSSTDQAYGFTSQRYDYETGLWYFKHRYLDDGLGRFISRDPAGYVDGMNLYTAYFVMTGTDPLGLFISYASEWMGNNVATPLVNAAASATDSIAPGYGKHVAAAGGAAIGFGTSVSRSTDVLRGVAEMPGAAAADAAANVENGQGVISATAHAFVKNAPIASSGWSGTEAVVGEEIGGVNDGQTLGTMERVEKGLDFSSAAAEIIIGAKAAGVGSPKKPYTATNRRVKLRKNTVEQIHDNQVLNHEGVPVDPNIGTPLKEGQIDIGHRKNQDWKTRKKMHEKQQSTREEVIEAENNPDLYQLEDRHENRSHRHE